MLFVLKPKKFCKPEQREDNFYKFRWAKVSLALSRRSGLFQLKMVASKKVKK